MSDNRIPFIQQPLVGTGSLGIGSTQRTVTRTGKDTTFEQLLDKELTGVKFSQHAIQRMQSRDIKLDSGDLEKLNNAVDKAAQKGAKESLIVMDNLALVVSVKNKMVITALDGMNMKENVFTNIDSAVIV